jgi:hypothetical protein
MSGTDARGTAHPQPLIVPVGTLGPTTPKPDKSLVCFLQPDYLPCASAVTILQGCGRVWAAAQASRSTMLSS